MVLVYPKQIAQNSCRAFKHAANKLNLIQVDLNCSLTHLTSSGI